MSLYHCLNCMLVAPITPNVRDCQCSSAVLDLVCLCRHCFFLRCCWHVSEGFPMGPCCGPLCFWWDLSYGLLFDQGILLIRIGSTLGVHTKGPWLKL